MFWVFRKKKKKKKPKYSDGVYHARITLAFTPIAALLSGAALFVPLDWPLRALAGALGCLFGIVCSPDLDLDGWNISERIWFKIPIVGYSLGYFWSWFFYPYSRLFRHRGSSHNLWLGTLGRVVYLLLWTPLTLLGLHLTASLIVGFANLPFTEIISGYLEFLLRFWKFGICFCIGLFISDVGHLLRDYKQLQI